MAIAAMHSYDGVHVLAADAGEADALERLLVDLTREGAATVEVIDGGRA